MCVENGIGSNVLRSGFQRGGDPWIIHGILLKFGPCYDECITILFLKEKGNDSPSRDEIREAKIRVLEHLEFWTAGKKTEHILYREVDLRYCVTDLGKSIPHKER